MLQRRWHISLVFCLGLSWTAVVVGCRSVQGDVRGTAAQKAVVPPLSTAGSTVVPAGGSNFTAAPAQLTSGNQHASPPATEPFIPTLPQLPDATPPVPQQLSPQASQPLMSRPLQATSVIPVDGRSIQNNLDCLPSEADWRKQMEEQTATLLRRLTQVEGELTSTRASLQAVNQSLQMSQVKIEQLNHDVTHWKSEVQRLEADMKAQQLADLKSLDELTESMHQVIVKQRPVSSAPKELEQ